MTRIIRIESCGVCPNKDDKGAFGPVSYVPVCRMMKRTLPYTEEELNGRVYASLVNDIPSWCQLEKLEEN